MTESEEENGPDGCQEKKRVNIPTSWVESDSKPFIESGLSLLSFTILSGLLSFSLFDLVNRSPLPTHRFEQQKYAGFNIDLSIAPGYTVADIHDVELFKVLSLSILTTILFLVLISTAGHWLRLKLEEVEIGSNGHLTRTVVPVSFGFLYLLSIIIILDHGPWMHYYPDPVVETNPDMVYNKSTFGARYNASTGLSRYGRKPFLAVLVIQFLIIAMTTYGYVHEIIPKNIKEKGSDYQQIYVNLWWKYTQVVLSVGVAITVGLIIPFSMNYTNYGRFGVIDVAIMTFSGLGAFISFSMAKIH